MKPRIYTIATTHLDTSWSWDFETTVRDFLPITLYDNFNLMTKYPDYNFSFEGSYRYELMEEYYPEGFRRVQKLAKEGRWLPSGSSYENGDVNVPSPEALFRNILYGNDYFEKKLGTRSKDIYLPDCFGFGWALPSVAAHANLLGFTTQKLGWSCAYGIPFELGKWQGVDGGSIYACFDGRNYSQTLKSVRKNGVVSRALSSNIKKYDLPFACVLHGIGDRGGAPKEASVACVVNEMKKNEESSVDVLSVSSDKIFRDMDSMLTAEQKSALPVWNNELVMTDHGSGAYTSRAISKRWNRKSEELADAAERINAAAHMLGLKEYPRKALDTAWKRVIAHQFHDDLTGTSLDLCYKRNWNDYVLSLNQFSEELSSAAAAILKEADTSFACGEAAAVYNPLAFSYRKTFVFTLKLSGSGDFARVYDSENNEIISQVLGKNGDEFTVAVNDRLPPCGIKIYDIRRCGEPCTLPSSLNVSEKHLENQKYSVEIDGNGDIFRIFDKELNKELLRAPIRTALFDYDGSITWPAWEMNYDEARKKPREYARNPVFSIEEQGLARISVKITRSAGESEFIQTVSLDEGGEQVEVKNEIEWRSLRTLLKTQFPLAPSNPLAEFDLGLGSIKRGNNRKNLYEFPAQKWADITNKDGSFGVAVLSDSKYGWDKPNNFTLRLTGIHTPKHAWRCAMHMMDFGKNIYSYALCSHGADGIHAVQNNAAAFNSQAFTFAVDKHSGKLGSEFSFCRCDSAIVRAIKLAQNSDEIVLRVNEPAGKSVSGVSVELEGLCDAREIFASEEPRSGKGFEISGNKLIFELDAFEVRSFAVKASPALHGSKPKCEAIPLPFNIIAATSNDNCSAGQLPGGISIPLEQYPEAIVCGGITFETAGGSLSALECRGQGLTAPENAESVYIIAASTNGDRPAEFLIGDSSKVIQISDFQERVGKWDLYSEGETAHIKRDTLAWNSTHAHGGDGDIYAKQLYFFKYKLETNGARSITLPVDSNIILLAASAVFGEGGAKPAAEFYDCAQKRPLDFELTEEEKLQAKSRKGHAKHRRKFLLTYVKHNLNKELRQLRHKK